MKGFVYHHPSVQQDVIIKLIRSTDSLSYVIQETQVRIQFISIRELDQIWEKGRAFGELFELRWHKTDTQYNVHLLTERELTNKLEIDWESQIEMQVGPPYKQYLWGRHWDWLEGEIELKKNLPNAWTEALIPGLSTLSYPLKQKSEFAFFWAIDYRLGGITQFTRFKGIDGENREKENVK